MMLDFELFGPVNTVKVMSSQLTYSYFFLDWLSPLKQLTSTFAFTFASRM